MFWKLISSLGALTLRSVERAHSYLADKNVSVCPSSDDNRFIFFPKERIAIARALLRNPKLLLLDEVNLDLRHEDLY
jgi:ABC-type molybdenum transport system ATPase subunit/photorepair protein PhrA